MTHNRDPRPNRSCTAGLRTDGRQADPPYDGPRMMRHH